MKLNLIQAVGALGKRTPGKPGFDSGQGETEGRKEASEER